MGIVGFQPAGAELHNDPSRAVLRPLRRTPFTQGPANISTASSASEVAIWKEWKCDIKVQRASTNIRLLAGHYDARLAKATTTILGLYHGYTKLHRSRLPVP